MRTRIFYVITSLLIISGLIMGCTAQVSEEQPDIMFPEAEEAPPVDMPTEQVITEDQISEPDAVVSQARFTIQADEALIEPVSALYEAFFPGESALFVENSSDLIAAFSLPDFANERPVVQATFLPNAVLVPASENPDIVSFVAFAISPEGQQVLIDTGALPSVVVLTDQAGNSMEIQQPVNRVISAYGPATAVMYSVNAGDRLVAASFLGARDPQGAAAMERIDSRFSTLVGDDYFSQSEFNIEHAATLNPDLIIGGARSAWADTVKQVGIDVFLMEAETPEQLKQAVLLIGQIFGPHAYAQAQAWVTYYDMVVDLIQEQSQDIPQEGRVQVLFTGTEPLRVASGEMYQTDIIESAGGISVSAELGGYWNDINIEQVAAWNPNMLIVPPYGGATIEAITESAEWQILDAVQAGQVYRMPKLVVPWDTPAPDSVLGIVWMAERINPDLVSLDCGVEAVYFYNTFYNYAISGEEIATICAIE